MAQLLARFPEYQVVDGVGGRVLVGALLVQSLATANYQQLKHSLWMRGDRPHLRILLNGHVQRHPFHLPRQCHVNWQQHPTRPTVSHVVDCNGIILLTSHNPLPVRVGFGWHLAEWIGVEMTNPADVPIHRWERAAVRKDTLRQPILCSRRMSSRPGMRDTCSDERGHAI